jgi:hypothetical protein
MAVIIEKTNIVFKYGVVLSKKQRQRVLRNFHTLTRWG